MSPIIPLKKLHGMTGRVACVDAGWGSWLGDVGASGRRGRSSSSPEVGTLTGISASVTLTLLPCGCKISHSCVFIFLMRCGVWIIGRAWCGEVLGNCGRRSPLESVPTPCRCCGTAAEFRREAVGLHHEFEKKVEY